MSKTNAVGWPLWVMIYRTGRTFHGRTEFFAADAEKASAYAAKWCEDAETETGRGYSVVNVKEA